MEVLNIMAIPKCLAITKTGQCQSTPTVEKSSNTGYIHLVTGSGRKK